MRRKIVDVMRQSRRSTCPPNAATSSSAGRPPSWGPTRERFFHGAMRERRRGDRSSWARCRDGSTGSFWFGKAASIPQGVLAVLGVTAVSIPPSRRAFRPARDLTRPLAERADNRRHDRDEKCSDPAKQQRIQDRRHISASPCVPVRGYLGTRSALCGGAILLVRGNSAHPLKMAPCTAWWAY